PNNNGFHNDLPGGCPRRLAANRISSAVPRGPPVRSRPQLLTNAADGGERLLSRRIPDEGTDSRHVAFLVKSDLADDRIKGSAVQGADDPGRLQRSGLSHSLCPRLDGRITL